MTLRRERTMYARLCVEVDLNAPLLSSYIVDGNKLRIEYEGLHLIYFSCGKFGHEKDLCHKIRARDADKPREQDRISGENLSENTVVNGQESDERFGDWMVVQGGRKGRRPMAREGKLNSTSVKSSPTTMQAGMSRFAALGVEEDVVEKSKLVENGGHQLKEKSTESTMIINKALEKQQGKVLVGKEEATGVRRSLKNGNSDKKMGDSGEQKSCIEKGEKRCINHKKSNA